MTDFQIKIYDGLKSIGDEIANFYQGGLMLITDDKIPSRSYLIAHSAREIDGGIRDILAPIHEKEKLQKTLSLERELRDGKGHIASILVALNLSIEDEFAREYINVALRFVEFTHRRGAYLSSRDSEEIINLWNRYEIILEKLVGSFINQIRQLEHISRFDEPSKEIIPTLKNLFKDNQKEFHFYKNLKNSNWFRPLYENGFLSPETIKDDVYWNQTEYLEYLSIQAKEGGVSTEIGASLAYLVEEIITYSETVEYINNFRIRYTLLLILTNIPKENIADNIIGIISHCIKTKYENILESSQIFQLYYSFLTNTDNISEHTETLEQLIKLIFGITDEEQFKDSSSYDNGKYFSYIRAYRLNEACGDQRFIETVASYCSDETIFYIADNLNKYLEASYEFSTSSVFKTNDIDGYTYSIKTNFTLLLKNVSIEIAKISPIRVFNIVEGLLSKRYTQPHILKIALFIIANTWEKTNEIFITYISEKDKYKLFSNIDVSKDLYYFLEDIAEKLNEPQTLQIIEIIEQGSQNENFYDNGGLYYDDFRLRWYSALSENKEVYPRYLQLSIDKGTTKAEIHPTHNEYVTFGSISPLSSEKISDMPVKELTDYLKTFDPKRGFRSPSVDGLENSLSESIKENPKLFIENTQSFLRVPYRYIFRIFSGLSEAHKQGKELNWKNILLFIEKYTSQKIFGSEKLKLKNASYPCDYTNVITSMCRFLSDGLKDDDRAFSKDLLPKVKLILFNFANKFISFELQEQHRGKLGSAMQVVNSTTGVIVSSILDYSLRNGRVNYLKDATIKWSNDEKDIFTSFAENGVQEFYVRFGWNKGNFFYLDKEWSKQVLKTIPHKDLQTRMSFFGGHIINPSSSTFEYKILKPLYEEAIINDWQIVDSTMGSSPFETHLLIFFISDYENLENESLLQKYLQKKNLKSIRGLVHSLSFKFEKYYLSLNEVKKEIFSAKIIRLWNYILSILEERKTDEKSDSDFGILLHLSKYINELNETTTNLFLRSSQFTSRSINIETVLKALHRFKEKANNPQNSLAYASQIFQELVLKEIRYASILKDEIIDFVEDMYKDGREELKIRANYICNEFARYGQFELRELYEKYN